MITNRFLGAILLITGTCVGAGMLGLPVTTASLGFSLSIGMIVFLWFVMCITGLLVLEVNLWFGDGVSYISMAQETLGKKGRAIAAISFLFLLYALMVAYLMAGSAIISHFFSWYFAVTLPHWVSIMPWVFVFGLLVYLGAHAVDVINKFFMIGLVVAFALLAIVITPHVHARIDTAVQTKYMVSALPVIIVTFGYHIIIPSMTAYLNRDKRALVKAIIIGSALPLCVYLLWQWLVYSIVPQFGPTSLHAIFVKGNVASGLTHVMSLLSESTVVSLFVRFFIFFAVASSFIGVSLGLFDLLVDGCKVEKNLCGRLMVACLTFIPPIFFTLVYPHGFLIALGYGGVFVAVLHGILPVAMVWRGRYQMNLSGPYRAPFGRFVLVLLFLLSCLVVYAQLATHMG